VARDILDDKTFSRVRESIHGLITTRPFLHEITPEPHPVIAGKSFGLRIAFADSQAGVRLISLRVESVDLSLHRVREVAEEELRNGVIVESLPPLAVGMVEVQATLYDNAGRADQFTQSFPVFRANPVIVIFYPSGRSLRLSNGAAAYSDTADTFACNANFLFSNSDNAPVTIDPLLQFRTTDTNGNVLTSGSFNFGAPIVVDPVTWSTGWWFNITYPKGNAAYNKLKAKEEVRTVYTFRFQNDAARILEWELSWRVLLGPRINIIRVGEENFTAAQKQKIIDGIRVVRSIYEQVDFTIGEPVDFWFITVAQAGGHLTIDDGGEAKDLTEEWTVRNDKMDVFISLDIKGAAGWSPVGGSCDKDASGEQTGSVVDIEGDNAYFGNSLAHEMGHYLGLDHDDDPNNFIGSTSDRNGDSDSSTGIKVSQYETMKKHCFVRLLGS